MVIKQRKHKRAECILYYYWQKEVPPKMLLMLPLKKSCLCLTCHSNPVEVKNNIKKKSKKQKHFPGYINMVKQIIKDSDQM